MAIKLNILEHQTQCIERITKVFEDIDIQITNDSCANPIFDTYDYQLNRNIKNIQDKIDGKQIPKRFRKSVRDNFGLDIKMETGTGKTYCYTRMIYELNKKYGFHKFIILVPTTPIKEGTKAFIESDYSKMHFSDLYPEKRLVLSVLNPIKTSRSSKSFPQPILDFAKGSILEKNKINVLLMNSGMLISKATMAKEYERTLFDTFSTPYDSLKATKPIVIIDEPHKFKRDNIAYKTLIDKIDPLCVIRFGSTYPEIGKTNEKDYNNLIFDLNACDAFNNNLVKGVATQMIEEENANETKIKLISLQPNKICEFKNEKTNKKFSLKEGDSLSIIDDEFSGIDVKLVGKTGDEDIKTGVVLSNGQILTSGDQIYAKIYGSTYQELMIEQAVTNHIEQERKNFLRTNKIKTLTLFFIDSIYSYRGDEEIEGVLRTKFENILKKHLENELKIYKDKKTIIEQEYCSFIKASLDDISLTNGGYFAEDNSSSEDQIKNEIDQILRDKDSLISFKDENGNWNTRRFIFSKWTLREGWDNPNVFQICKLRSSGSEISKLQEVGRGLRLPVDEFGNRISDEQFYLTYLYDYSEKNFADKLVNEINNNSIYSDNQNIKELIAQKCYENGKKPEELFSALLLSDYVDIDGNVIEEKREQLFEKYPYLRQGIAQNKIIDRNKKTKNEVGIRKDKFNQLKDLWAELNKKYYLTVDKVTDDELYEAVKSILSKNIYKQVIARTTEQKLVSNDESNKVELIRETKHSFILNEELKYGEFLTQAQKNTSIPAKIIHRALCDYNKMEPLEKDFFNKNTLAEFIRRFHVWFQETFVTKFSYKSLEIERLETALTDINGEPKQTIVQGNIGIIKDDKLKVPENFLYDKFVYDSEKEKQNISTSGIDEVIVFGKIPRRSIQVPLYFGGTTSPDFMYVIKQDDKLELNLIVETKDVDQEISLRGEEKLKIKSAEKFFENLKNNNKINVVFRSQFKNDEIISIIQKIQNKK
ncbi:type III restriction-modification system endonuclease [Mycoplasma feriruminatoris]|uniref:type III restriction-modification system endonuclease n=1 Tax=Mycoplasma feriruminatoris TaxID=1179777 RepID=UPI00241D06E8|nr:type III restriction-modification system endonuclease [Mycoplasma feriruminatoris]WFQ94682.1 hypothetical protein MFERI15220_00764 [Mycoplasma feriruminatoris]